MKVYKLKEPITFLSLTSEQARILWNETKNHLDIFYPFRSNYTFDAETTSNDIDEFPHRYIDEWFTIDHLRDVAITEPHFYETYGTGKRITFDELIKLINTIKEFHDATTTEDHYCPHVCACESEINTFEYMFGGLVGLIIGVILTYILA